MKTLIAAIAVTLIAQAGAHAQNFKQFAGKYRPLPYNPLVLADPDKVFSSNEKKLGRVYDPLMIKVDHSGRIQGQARMYFIDVLGNKTTKPVRVKFTGKLTKPKKLPFLDARTATLKMKGSDGSRLSGQAIYEKSTFGLTAKRNLVFEIVRGAYSGRGLLVYGRK